MTALRNYPREAAERYCGRVVLLTPVLFAGFLLVGIAAGMTAVQIIVLEAAFLAGLAAGALALFFAWAVDEFTRNEQDTRHA